MAIAINDLYEIIDEQRYDNQQVLNRYIYRVEALESPPATLAEVGEAWWLKYSPFILPLQNAGVQHLQVRVEQIGGLLQYGQYTIPAEDGAGTLSCTGDYLSSFLAYGLTLQGETRATKPGGKRYVGGCEGDMLPFGVVAADRIADLEELGAQLTDPLRFPDDPSGNTLRLVIYRPSNGVDPEVVNPVTGYLTNPNWTTQNTRKRGRGS